MKFQMRRFGNWVFGKDTNVEFEGTIEEFRQLIDVMHDRGVTFFA